MGLRRTGRALVLLALGLPLLAGHKGGGAPDRDGDGIPDARDPFPDDRERPGKARPDTVYAHSSSTLFTIERERGTPNVVGDFSFSDGIGRQVTDIAIDPWGVTWAVAFGTFMTCHPGTARCEVLRELPGSFNALTVLEARGAEEVQLFGVTTDGRWFRWSLSSEPVEIGHHGAASSGDAYRVGSRVRASRDGAGGRDELIELDPNDPSSVRVLASLDAQEMYGLAACSDRVYGFDASGRVYRGRDVELAVIGDTRIPWWGAACSGPERVPPVHGGGSPGDAEAPATPASSSTSSSPGQSTAEHERGGCSCR